MRASRVDDNQKEIVQSLRKFGCSVYIVSQLKGFCDIVVGWRGYNYLFEIKDPNKPPSQRKLTPKEKEFHESWNGQVAVIYTADDVVKILAEAIW